jgi:hypothetical protein
MRAKTIFIFSLTLSLLLLTISCSSGPAAPEKGTPPFYWAAANETFATGDYIKTLEHLDSLLKTDNQYTAQAYPWYLVLSTGMTHGYIELADRFETGARMSKENSGSFRRQVSTYRGLARAMTLPFVEKFQAFQKNNKDTEIQLGFPYPSGSQGEPISVSRVAGGILPPEAELETAQAAELKRTVLLATARATGSGDDTTKAQALFKAGPVKVSRAVFMQAMADALYDHAMLFQQKKMDEPQRMKLMLSQAAGALTAVPGNKAVKELSTKIDKAQKTLKKT